MIRINKRSLIVAIHDAVMAATSFLLSVYIRLGEEGLYLAVDYLASGMLIFTCICVMTFSFMGLYRGQWRFASMRDVVTIVKSATLAVMVFAVVMFLLTRLELLPRSVLFINWMVLIGLVTGPRFIYRSLKDRTLFWEMTLEEKAKIPVLLIGANHLAEQFIQDMSRDLRTPYRVVAILDDDQGQHQRMLQRVKIYGGLSALEETLAILTRNDQRPHKLLISDHRLSGEAISELMKMADKHAIPVARIPRLSEIKQRFDDTIEIQPIAIEDLLGRPQTALDRSAVQSLVAGKRVLITGAGGSIGGELARQIKQYDPTELIVLDACEFNLYQISRELGTTHNILGDVRDHNLIDQIFSKARPEIVFHAAAIKHVPMAEKNPEEAILTNVMGSQCVADACVKHQVAAMVLISTDKAVNPQSIMGATKKLAEAYCQSLATKSSTRFITVRFGNVLGSTGSVVPLFREQIAKGGPITVTHEEMTRYFMTIREAIELVLQATAMGTGMSEQSAIFVLDMGKPIKIVELAMQMIKLAGLKPHEDIAITYTGLRPGEKLHEELFHETENLGKTPHASIFLANPRASVYSELAEGLEALKKESLARRRSEALILLKKLVPECHLLQEVA